MNKSAGLVAVSFLLAAQAVLAATPAEICAAAKNKAALKQAAAKAKCYQKAFAKGVAVDSACLSAADAALVAAIDKIDAKGGCVNTGDSSAIQAAVDNCVDSIVTLTPTETPSCTLTPACTAGHDCVSLVDNSGDAQFGLRMSQLDLAKPSALSGGIVGTILRSNMVINGEASCNLNGSGTFNWLLKFDTGMSALITSGAKPVADPTSGYSLLNESLLGTSLSAIGLPVTIAGDGTFSTTSVGNVNIPVYFDSMAASAIVLPLRSVSFTGALSANHSCIGSYNAAGLQVSNLCQPDGMNESFVNGGTVHAFVNLEDADALVVPALSQSLCVVLTGDSDGGMPAHCKRTMGTINAQGDWCTMTNSAAPGCNDALEFSGSFAASSVTIQN